ncbi:MAG: histidine--tRNA ligase, partial [Pirellulales bacterium]
MIEPRTLKGFRDFLPEQMLPRERLMEIARTVYRSYGFRPIDTPALEYLDILLGNGSEETDKQLYRFHDHGGRAVGLRFDLTVPLARFVSQHMGKLGTPFKRYQIASVWRGENTQRGRYREFMQCDYDTIGTRSVVADIETTLVMHDLLRAIGIERFTIHINDRRVLNGLLDKLQLADRSASILRTLDKLGKIGPQRVARELVDSVGLTDAASANVLQLSEISGTHDQVLTALDRLVGEHAMGREGIDSLKQLVEGVQAAGVPPARIDLDPSIARGLDYYTGTVFETTLDDLPTIGSVCSGGRYDDLTGLYSRQPLPGIGASLGLDRLLAAMDELELIETTRTSAPVLIPFFDPDRLSDYLRIASQIRAAGIGVELYPEAKRLGAQLKYANRQGFRIALIAGQEELDAETCQVKDLQTGKSVTVSLG